MGNIDEKVVKADRAEEMSPHNKALYEAGKNLLIESVGVGREFCKFMTTTAFSAIPIYLGLLKFVLPNNYFPQLREEIMFLIPPTAFLISAVVFILGYFPQKGNLSLDLPSDIERERSMTILRRQNYALIAFIIFAFGVIFGTCIIIGSLPKVKIAA